LLAQASKPLVGEETLGLLFLFFSQERTPALGFLGAKH
jgi:hypothetical protein